MAYPKFGTMFLQKFNNLPVFVVNCICKGLQMKEEEKCDVYDFLVH